MDVADVVVWVAVVQDVVDVLYAAQDAVLDAGQTWAHASGALHKCYGASLVWGSLFCLLKP